jgi:hypothetical protein
VYFGLLLICPLSQLSRSQDRGEITQDVCVNKNITYQKLWDTVLIGKFIVTSAYIKKIKDLSYKDPSDSPQHLRKTNKQNSKLVDEKR